LLNPENRPKGLEGGALLGVFWCFWTGEASPNRESAKKWSSSLLNPENRPKGLEGGALFGVFWCFSRVLAQEIPKTVLRGWRGEHFWHFLKEIQREKEREEREERERIPGEKTI